MKGWRCTPPSHSSFVESAQLQHSVLVPKLYKISTNQSWLPQPDDPLYNSSHKAQNILHVYLPLIITLFLFLYFACCCLRITPGVLLFPKDSALPWRALSPPVSSISATKRLCPSLASGLWLLARSLSTMYSYARSERLASISVTNTARPSSWVPSWRQPWALYWTSQQRAHSHTTQTTCWTRIGRKDPLMTDRQFITWASHGT